MILNKELVTFIHQVVKTAQLVNIDSIIIEPNKIRAIDENGSIAIFHTENIPELPFATIGLNRLKLLASRLAVVEQMPNFKTSCVINRDMVASLEFTADKTKIEYRCANPASIRAPKNISDVPIHSFNLNKEGVQMLKRGHSMMPQNQPVDVVNLVSNKDGMFFELKDLNNDTFSFRFAEQARNMSDSSPCVFVYSYPVKVLAALFENNTTTTIHIGEKTLNIKVNNLNCYVVRQT